MADERNRSFAALFIADFYWLDKWRRQRRRRRTRVCAQGRARRGALAREFVPTCEELPLRLETQSELKDTWRRRGLCTVGCESLSFFF